MPTLGDIKKKKRKSVIVDETGKLFEEGKHQKAIRLGDGRIILSPVIDEKGRRVKKRKPVKK